MSDVPHLRFPEFRGEWEKHTIGELAIKVGSGVTPKGGETVYKKEGHPFVRSQNVGLGVLLLEDIAYIDDTTHIRQKNTELQIDDVLLNITGASIGRSAVVNEQIAGGNVNQHVCIIRTKDNLVSSFLCNFLLSNYGQKQIDSFQAGGNRQGLNFEQIKSIKIGIPCVKEQSKIAKTLQLLDERIATQNKIIEDLKLLKDAITERLYSEVNGTVYTYHQLFDVINERNKDNVYNNVLSAIQELGMIDRSDINIDIKFEQASIVSYKIVRKGDYVVHLRSFQGGFAFSEKTGICSPAYTILRPNDNLIYGYLSHYFTSKQFVKSLKLVTYGIRDGRSINVDEWLDMKVAIPEKQVQSHILTTINSIGCRLRNEDKIYSRLIKQKSYLLRQMFI